MLALPPPRIRLAKTTVIPATQEQAASLQSHLDHARDLLSRADWLALCPRREPALRGEVTQLCYRLYVAALKGVRP